MDETIAELYTMNYFIASLTLNNETMRNIKIPESLTKSLKISYNKFVKNILKEETSNPLGILRPGILEVMSKLCELKKRGKVKHVIIYSNNGSLESIEFIRDLIHKHVGTKIIKECIDWYHPMREKPANPSNANKTWREINTILTHGKCKDANVKQEDVFFFDDLAHKDLMKNLMHYYKVPPYSFKASFDRVNEIFMKSMSNVNMTLFAKYFYQIYNIDITEYKKTKTSTKVPIPDKGIDMMMEAIKIASLRS